MGGASAMCSRRRCRLLVLMRLVHILALLQSSNALRRTGTLRLASTRIDTAKSQLTESAAALDEVCGSEVLAAQEGLARSTTKVVDDPDAARRELVGVEGFLESCFGKLADRPRSASTEVYGLLTEVGQSVASAETLIYQSVVAAAEVADQVDDVDDEGSVDEPDSAVEGAATADDDDDDSMATSSTGVAGRDDRRKWMGELGKLRLLPMAPTVHIPMQEMLIDYCRDHVDFPVTSSATIRLDRLCGGKFHTRTKYDSGVFTIRMRAPTGAAGVSNSFYISSADANPDIISFDFMGNLPNRVLTAYAVDGDHTETLQTFHMDFDTSADFHEYTINWDEESVVWVVDGTVIRTLRSARARAYPKKPGHVFGYSWDASAVADGNWAGRVDWENAPFFMYYDDFQVASPLHAGQWRPVPGPQSVGKHGGALAAAPLRRLVIDYGPSHVGIEHHSGVATITFDELGRGGRVRSLRSYPAGRFSAAVKCADGDTSGLLTSFYVSSREGSNIQDEIDFEFLGADKRIVQTNFYVNGTSVAEQSVDLDFDCSAAFHTYSIVYTDRHIQWFVDSRLVRTVLKTQQLQQEKPFPSKKVFLYASVWNASAINDGLWTGKWHGVGLPFVAKFKDITIQCS